MVVFFSDILFNYSDVELPVCLINLLTYLYLLGYKQLKSSQVCSEPPPSALNMTLSVFGAERRLGACSTAPAAIDQYLLQIPALSSKPAGHRCCCRSTGQTDTRTDDRPLHRPCSAHYAGSANKLVFMFFVVVGAIIAIIVVCSLLVLIVSALVVFLVIFLCLRRYVYRLVMLRLE